MLLRSSRGCLLAQAQPLKRRRGQCLAVAAAAAPAQRLRRQLSVGVWAAGFGKPTSTVPKDLQQPRGIPTGAAHDEAVWPPSQLVCHHPPPVAMLLLLLLLLRSAVTKLEWQSPLQIIKYPDPRLRAPNARINVFDDSLLRLAKEMTQLMYLCVRVRG